MKHTFGAAWSLTLAIVMITVGSLADVAADDGRGGEVGILVGALSSVEELSGEDQRSTDPVLGLRGGSAFTPRLGWYVDALYHEVETGGPLGTAGIVTGRTGFDWMFQPRRDWRWFATLGGGWIKVDFSEATVEDFHRPLLSAGFGQRILLGRGLRLRWELRADRTFDDNGIGGTDLDQGMVLVGLQWGPGRSRPTDSDMDGVYDRRDRCPGSPEGALVDGRGCELDSDSDGVPDGVDRCPNTRTGDEVGPDGCLQDADGDGVPDITDSCSDTLEGAIVDEWGCPGDADRDGVPNGVDRCPYTPLGARVDIMGCPMDSDGDGVVDGVDQCPDTPGGATVDWTGCPLADDEDGDGVPDEADRCSGTPRGVEVDGFGCSRAAGLFDRSADTLVLEGVYFELGSAALTPDSRGTLNALEASLAAWPDVRIEIGGHTDSQGSDRSNRELSARRAAAVRDYLIGLGVDADRLTARGYGADLPIADNATPEGRSRNRRVELRRLD